MWRLCAVTALLLTSAPPAAGVTCDHALSNIQLDLPGEDVYTCTEDYIPLPGQVLPSIASVYEQERSSHVCMDTAIVYTAAIPNSGIHRSTWAKYGEYIYCPPQQWVHNLKHGGVAFLYHPCVHPKLKEALSCLARHYVAKHIITPLPTLSRDRPLALAAWCSTLEMSHIKRTEVIGWLRDNVHIEQQYNPEEEGSYQHLLIRPSVTQSGDSTMYKRVQNYVTNKGSRMKKRTVKTRRRRLALPVTVFVQKTTEYNVSQSTGSTAAPAPQPGELINNQSSVLSVSVTANTSSLPDPVTTTPSVDLPLEAKTEGSRTEIHSRELDGSHRADLAGLSPNMTAPTPGGIAPGSPGLNLGLTLEGNASQEVSHHDNTEVLPNSAVTQHVESPESKQSKESVSPVLLPKPTPQNVSNSTEQQILPSEKPSTDKEQKQECKCQQDVTVQVPAKAQRRLGVSHQKNAGVFVSTPRTEEAKWAAASLIFLFALLTFSVLYTQIYKKFRKSKSLYWTSESHSEEKESVASVIKRRLVQGHSIRKKWIGRKKSPVVLYESLSESSD
ncbi:tumor protein p53-inducible protein 13 isoform 2-T2 [Leptodactylus fuscus]|uniref:tumor protein p53-inducible protein 13 isoform X2 n=1 Tax=Leptodactylus fuscus TaxID=238119 RepID=UPI003F4EDE60